MNMGKKITELSEGMEITGESRYLVHMGDGTGTKQVRHADLVRQFMKNMELSYDETMELLNAEETENPDENSDETPDDIESEEE